MIDHRPLVTLSPDKGYLVQDIPVLSLCEKHEGPFFVYDLDLAVERYNELRSSFPWPQVKMLYAMKANYNPDLLRALLAQNACIDAVSPAEVIFALRLGFKPEDILYTANSMTNKEIQEVKNLGVLLNFDSLSGLDRFGQAFPGSEVCVRFNPDVVAGENVKIQTGGDLTKFGIIMDDVEKVLEIVKRHDLKVVGLHEHTGSGISDTDKVLQSINNLLSLAKREWFPDLRFIDFGGGFKAPYKPDEQRIDYQAFGAVVVERFSEFCREYGRELAIYFEPGKYVAAEFAMMVVQVNTLKTNRTRQIAGTEAGFPHLIRPVFYGAYHHIVNLSNPNGKLKKYDIAGNICETGDCFATDRELPEIREGDYLAILNAGAYCYSMASIYNLRPLPPEIVVEGGKARISSMKTSNTALVDQVLANYQ